MLLVSYIESIRTTRTTKPEIMFSEIICNENQIFISFFQRERQTMAQFPHWMAIKITF